MKELERVTDKFVLEVNELLGLIVYQCTIKNLANMSREEIEMMQMMIKLVNTSNDILVGYQKEFNEINSKLDIITKLLVAKDNEGQK